MKSESKGKGAEGTTLVVGAGIVGIACALNLLRDGHKVTLVDKNEPGEGASRGNAGIMAASAIVPVPQPGLLRKMPGMLLDPLGPVSFRWGYMARRAPWFLDYLRNAKAERVEAIAAALATVLGGSVQEHQRLAYGTPAEKWLQPSPYYYANSDEAAFGKDAFAWDLRRKHGYAFEVITGDSVNKLEPYLDPSYRCLVSLENHGFIREPMRLVKALAEAFTTAGGTFLRRDIHDIEIGPDGPFGLVTDQGPATFDTLVVAAGVWSGQLARRLGSPVPIESERGYHIVLTDPGIMPNSPIMSAKGKFVATPMATGLRLAGLVEFAGLEAPPNYAMAKRLLKHARLMFPGVRTEAYEEWMGHRPSLPDSLPVIGRSPHFDNVYFAFGHQHIGMTGGPKTGRLIADLIAGRKPNEDLTPFRVDRFG